jgi:hypothetical protein
MCIAACFAGGAFEISEGSLRLVAWVEVPNLGGETRERRIVARLAMPRITGDDVLTALSQVLALRRPLDAGLN